MFIAVLKLVNFALALLYQLVMTYENRAKPWRVVGGLFSMAIFAVLIVLTARTVF